MSIRAAVSWRPAPSATVRRRVRRLTEGLWHMTRTQVRTWQDEVRARVRSSQQTKRTAARPLPPPPFGPRQERGHPGAEQGLPQNPGHREASGATAGSSGVAPPRLFFSARPRGPSLPAGAEQSGQWALGWSTHTAPGMSEGQVDCGKWGAVMEDHRQNAAFATARQVWRLSCQPSSSAATSMANGRTSKPT